MMHEIIPAHLFIFIIELQDNVRVREQRLFGGIESCDFGEKLICELLEAGEGNGVVEPSVGV